MKIRIEIDVPDNSNGTKCIECPFKSNARLCSWAERKCYKVDFSEMEVKELEENNESKS